MNAKPTPIHELPGEVRASPMVKVAPQMAITRAREGPYTARSVESRRSEMAAPSTMRIPALYEVARKIAALWSGAYQSSTVMTAAESQDARRTMREAVFCQG